MLVYQALQIKFSIVRHVFAKYLRMRFVCVRHTRVRAFLHNSGQSNHAQYTNMVQQCCVTCQDIAPVVCSSHLVFSRACSQHQNSIPRTGPGASACTQHGTCAAGLPGICDVNLVCRTMDDDISASARSRGISQPEIPTQGAPARAGCPTPAAKSAPSGTHSRQNAQVSEWRTRPIAWPSRRRDRLLNRGFSFLTPSLFPPHARTRPAQEACNSQTQQRLTKFRSKEHDLGVISSQSFQAQKLGLGTA